jgi:4'-phosphopantetheinyl transferase
MIGARRMRRKGTELEGTNHNLPLVRPGETVAIDPGDVHVWTAILDPEAESFSYYEGLLSQDENARSGKYRFPRDQRRFVLCRGILRELLGSYLSAPPNAIEFTLASKGKPMLAAPVNTIDIRFNVSHSQDFAIFAFSVGKEIGVDAELIRDDIEAEQIAERFFSDQEQAELRLLEGEEHRAGFFLCWTRKEAYLKARGDGLEKPLNSFSVTLAPRAPVRLLSEDSFKWSLYSLDVAPGWAAALAVEGVPSRILLSGDPDKAVDAKNTKRGSKILR